MSPTSQSRDLIPVDVAAGRAKKPIHLAAKPVAMVLSPDGRIIYLVNPVPGTVTPMSAATGRTGTPIEVATGRAWPAIRVGGAPLAMVIVP